MTKRWVRVPAPGEFRGEGEWKEFDQAMKDWGYTANKADAEWEDLQVTKYLPTQISEEKPHVKEMGQKG